MKSTPPRIICKPAAVAPFAGAWIEILMSFAVSTLILSLPSRERGLKSAYIEDEEIVEEVAPFAGAWIEISTLEPQHPLSVSLPSRERGLKYYTIYKASVRVGVAPFAGAWIEIGSWQK